MVRWPFPRVARSAWLSTWLVAFVIGASSTAEGAPADILVTAAELEELLDQPGRVVVFDVRTVCAYSQGHLPGALPLPDATVSPHRGPLEHQARLGSLGLDGSETVVVYGGPGDEAELASAFLGLEYAGVADVRILDRGLSGWLDHGGALTKNEHRPSPRRFVGALTRMPTVEAPEILSLLGSEAATIVDVRAGEGWRLHEPTPEFAEGHLPTALLFDFSTVVGSDGSWPTPERVHEELERFGPRPGTGVDLGGLFILYGDGPEDHRSALAYTLLRLAGLDAQVYPGGWKGWTASGSLPVARIVTADELASLQAETQRPGEGSLFPRLPVLDLRELRDWEVGHVPGSFPITAEEFPRFFELVIDRYWPAADPLRDPLVLYCYGPECIRSRVGTVVAVRAGWRNIYWFRNGVSGWYEAGYPFERLAATEAPWSRGTGR